MINETYLTSQTWTSGMIKTEMSLSGIVNIGSAYNIRGLELTIVF